MSCAVIPVVNVSTNSSRRPLLVDPTEEPPKRHILTKQFIQKECIKHGFYRTPSCNEKLYLHHKSYEGIDPMAFVEYTDVKVLWLESNCLSELQCGAEFVELAPKPVEKDIFDVQEESAAPVTAEPAAEDKSTNEKQATKLDTAEAQASDSNADLAKTVESRVENDPTIRSSSTTVQQPTPTATPPPPPESVDIFSSQYPTLRQLFLHGNMFMQMPDLYRFQRLDTLNLSDNFIAAVRVGCPGWRADDDAKDVPKTASTNENATSVNMQSVESPSKSATREQLQQQQQAQQTKESHEESEPYPFTTKSESGRQLDVALVPVTVSEEDKKKLREDRLKSLQADVENWRTRCSHTACFDPMNPDAPGSRCLCGTLTTLYLKNNHLAKVESLAELLCLQRLSVLDLSNNRLEDGDELLVLLSQLSELRALYLAGNPLVRKLPNYRKVVLSKLPKLMHLDDRPVFEDERRLVKAWAAEGLEGEKKERKKMREEDEEKQRRRLAEFRALMAAARNGRDPYDTNTEEDTDSNPTPDTSDGEEGTENRVRLTNTTARSNTTTTRPRQLSSNQRTSAAVGAHHVDPMMAAPERDDAVPQGLIIAPRVEEIIEEDENPRPSLLFSGNANRPSSSRNNRPSSAKPKPKNAFYEMNYGAEIRQRDEEEKKVKTSNVVPPSPPPAPPASSEVEGTESATTVEGPKSGAATAETTTKLPVMTDNDDDLWVPS